MNKGAFQISREIFENPIWNDIIKFRIFFYIVGKAVFSEKGIRKGNVLIQRGQYLRSYRNLIRDLEYIENRSIKHYSLSTMNRKVEQLVKENRLKIEDTELGTLFTVVNYDMYQGLANYKNSNLVQEKNADGTAGEQTENNNKNGNNVNNEKKKDISNEIKDLRYSFPIELNSLIDEYWEVIKRTRKTNKVSDSVILKTMQQWKKYDVDVIRYSIKKHIEAYDDGERKENYTLGIMRNTTPEQARDELNKKSHVGFNSSSNNQPDPRDREIALQKWITNGNDPNEFNWND